VDWNEIVLRLYWVAAVGGEGLGVQQCRFKDIAFGLSSGAQWVSYREGAIHDTTGARLGPNHGVPQGKMYIFRRVLSWLPTIANSDPKIIFS